MSSFTTKLDVSPFNDAMTLWILNESFTYVIGDLETGTEKVVAPKGFITDFATTKWLKPVLPPTGRYGKACVIHDYLCVYKLITLSDGTTRKASRKEADYIFLEAMRVLGVHPIIKYTMFGGTRLWATITNKK